MKEKFVHEPKRVQSKSPELIVPILMEWFKPSSVVDVGCGLGNWLRAFDQAGINDYMGVDGYHLNKNLIVIDEAKLLLADLEKPIPVQRKFDLAISLEVAEHLSEGAADTFVQSLTQLSDRIIFSAAVPHQGGFNHINEQWPNYWQDKFRAQGYQFFDPLRSLIWNMTEVEPWYKQNTFVVLKQGIVSKFEEVDIVNYVHPDLFEQRSGLLDDLQQGKAGLREPLAMFVKALLSNLGLRN